MFAIDVAWCLSMEDFKRQLEFFRNVTIGLGDVDIRTGALVYSKVANITFNLGDFSTNWKLNALRSFSTLFRFVSVDPVVGYDKTLSKVRIKSVFANFF